MNLLALATWAKDNPLVSLGGVLAAVVVGAIALDERYAHAEDVKAQVGQIGNLLEINRLQSEISGLELRQGTLKDKVYEGAARRTRSLNQGAENAITERYSAELREVTEQLAAKRVLIDKLRTGK